MANLHLVTGYAGKAHVTAEDHGSLFDGAIRGGNFVLEAGNKFSASAIAANTIRVLDGELVMRGRHVKLDPGSYVDLNIETGAQGYSRNDLIVARYTRDSSSGIEECNLVVIKGTAAESNPEDPAYTTADPNNTGTLQHDFPLYRVPLTGVTIGTLVALFTPEKSLYEINSGKADKVTNATAGNMAILDANGNLQDSGRKPGAAGGVATLDSEGKVPSGQLPSLDYIPTSQKGAASGVAPLNADKRIESTYLPVHVLNYNRKQIISGYRYISTNSSNTVSTTMFLEGTTSTYVPGNEYNCIGFSAVMETAYGALYTLGSSLPSGCAFSCDLTRNDTAWSVHVKVSGSDFLSAGSVTIYVKAEFIPK